MGGTHLRSGQGSSHRYSFTEQGMRLGDRQWIWSDEERGEDLKSAYQLCSWETPVGSQGVPAEIKQGSLRLRGKDN